MAYRACDSLMGVWLHGMHSLSQAGALNINNIWALSCLLYSLDVLIVTVTWRTKLELFHRQTLPALLGLLDRTLYLIIELQPSEAILDQKILMILLTIKSIFCSSVDFHDEGSYFSVLEVTCV